MGCNLTSAQSREQKEQRREVNLLHVCYQGAVKEYQSFHPLRMIQRGRVRDHRAERMADQDGALNGQSVQEFDIVPVRATVTSVLSRGSSGRSCGRVQVNLALLEHGYSLFHLGSDIHAKGATLLACAALRAVGCLGAQYVVGRPHIVCQASLSRLDQTNDMADVNG